MRDAIVRLEVCMKKGKKDRESAQKVRVKSRDKEVEMKEHLHALTDKKEAEKRKEFIYKLEREGL